MRSILFRGPTTSKIIRSPSRGEMRATVIPLIVMQEKPEETGVGVVLQCQVIESLDGTDWLETDTSFELVDVYAAWIDPVRWWRVLQFVDALSVINERLFHLDLFVAAGRYKADDHSRLSVVDEVRCEIERDGTHSYDEIMGRPVPSEIVRLVIDLANAGLDIAMARYHLPNEIMAGTVRWSQELKGVGVPHPAYKQAVLAARDELVTRYATLLISYAAFQEMPYTPFNHREKCTGMIDIEWQIYAAIERGLEQQYGMLIAVAVAILKSAISTDDILEELARKHPDDSPYATPFIRPPPEKRFAETTTWLRQQADQSALHEADFVLIQRLYREWNSLPEINPLVT